MSLFRPVLNTLLRVREKRYLQRVSEPEEVRRSFERKARIMFHSPWGLERAKTVLGGRPTLELSSKGAARVPVILYLHGGAYVFGSPEAYDALAGRLCKTLGAKVVLPDYRKAPEHLFPAAVEDAKAAWADLLTRGEDPSQIVIGGDSAGGGLALALLAELIRAGGPLPAGLFAFSPLTDMTFQGKSIRENAKSESLLPAERVHEMAQMYLGAQDPQDPRASPLFADFNGAPPIWLAVSSTELLRDDTVTMVDRLKASGVSCEAHIGQGLPHVWPMFHNYLPEARSTVDDLAKWVRPLTDRTAES